KSPLASERAFLHSIMPAPVWSRSFLTCSAVIVAMVVLRTEKRRPAQEPAPGRTRSVCGTALGGCRGRFAGASNGRPRLAPVVVGAAIVGRVARVIGLSGFLHAATGQHRVGDAGRKQANRPQRIVVAGDHEVDLVRIAVGVDDANDRDLELAGLVDGNLFL